MLISGVLAGDTFGMTVEPRGGTIQPTVAPFVAIPAVLEAAGPATCPPGMRAAHRPLPTLVPTGTVRPAAWLRNAVRGPQMAA